MGCHSKVQEPSQSLFIAVIAGERRRDEFIRLKKAFTQSEMKGLF